VKDGKKLSFKNKFVTLYESLSPTVNEIDEYSKSVTSLIVTFFVDSSAILIN